MRVFEKHMAVEGEPRELKLMADALDFYARAMNIELPKTMGDLRYNMEASYQTHNNLDEDDWEMTEEDKEHFDICQDDGDHD